MELLFREVHTVAGLSYLVISQITLICIIFTGGAWRLEPTTLARFINFLNKMIPSLLVTLGILYFICYSFKIYWWGTTVFFLVIILLLVTIIHIHRSEKSQTEFLDGMNNWKVTLIWEIPLIVYFIYVYASGIAIISASNSIQSIFGTYLL